MCIYLYIYCIPLPNGEYLKSCIAHQKLLLQKSQYLQVCGKIHIFVRYLFIYFFFIVRESEPQKIPFRFYVSIWDSRWDAVLDWNRIFVASSWLRVAVYRYHNFDSRTSLPTSLIALFRCRMSNKFTKWWISWWRGWLDGWLGGKIYRTAVLPPSRLLEVLVYRFIKFTRLRIYSNAVRHVLLIKYLYIVNKMQSY